MFKAKFIATGETITIFAVDVSLGGGCTYFLVWTKNSEWKWLPAEDFVPAE